MHINFIHFPGARSEFGMEILYNAVATNLPDLCSVSRETQSDNEKKHNSTPNKRRFAIRSITTEKMLLLIILYRKSKYLYYDLHFTLAYVSLPCHKLSYFQGPEVISNFPELHYLRAPNTAPPSYQK
jgi:hypothetical protein